MWSGASSDRPVIHRDPASLGGVLPDVPDGDFYDTGTWYRVFAETCLDPGDRLSVEATPEGLVLPLRERLIANLPHLAHRASRLAPALNLRDRIPFVARLSERMLGFSAKRSLPKWGRPWKEARPVGRAEDVKGDGLDLVLFGDTFNRYFERENLEAAERVLLAAGYRLHRVQPAGSSRIAASHHRPRARPAAPASTSARPVMPPPARHLAPHPAPRPAHRPAARQSAAPPARRRRR